MLETILRCTAVAAVGYLLGSVNSAVILSRIFYKEDVRMHGSGNAGSTNMLRNYGAKAFFAALICDMLKAVIGIVFAHFVVGGDLGTIIAGLACIIGHAYPVFFGFKGGKSVAVTAVIAIALDPLSAAVAIAVFLVVAILSKYISLGSITAVTVYFVVLLIFRGLDNAWLYIPEFFHCAFIVWLHRANIKRLLSGTENKVSLFGKKSKAE